jgi:hypothetical protein
MWLMGLTFVFAYGGSLAAIIMNMLKSQVTYDSSLRMCIVSRSESTPLIVSASLPLAFELLAMGLTCWNVIDRPRDASTPLNRALAKDGFLFFLVSSILTVARYISNRLDI